jgi:hypothetical protein
MYRIFASVMLSVLLFASVPVWADTLQATSGNFSFFSGAVTPGLLGTINGSNFSYSVSGQHLMPLWGSTGFPTHHPVHFFHTPGTVLNFGGQASADGSMGPGLTMNGTTYRANSQFFFTAPPVVLTPPSNQQTFTLQTSFAMTGTIQALSSSGPPSTWTPVFSVNVTGQGTATGTFRQAAGFPEIFMSQINFGFVPGDTGTPGGGAPVPEPTTMLLVASGLAGMRFWRRRAAG